MNTSMPSAMPSSEPAAVSESWERLRSAGQLGDALTDLERAADRLAKARGQAIAVHGLVRAGAISSILADVNDAAEELRGLIGAPC